MKVIHLMSHSQTKVEVELSDWRGTPIDIGSKVAYAATAGAHSISVYEAEIVDLKLDNNRWVTSSAEYLDKKMFAEGFDQDLYDKMVRYLALGFKAKGKIVHQLGGFSQWEKPDRITTFKMSNRITVLK